MLIQPQRRPSPQPTIQSLTIPAPIGGLNTMDAGASMPPTDCILCYNMVAAEYGLRVRLGFRTFATGLGNEVRTIIPFTGSESNGSRNRLFAATQDGIFDVTSGTPVQVIGGTSGIAWDTSDPSNAGFATSCVFVNFAGGHFLLLCDEVNGYFTYTENDTTWRKITNGNGAAQVFGTDGAQPTPNPLSVDPGKFSFVTVWQNRVWFIQRNTTTAWYTAPGALYGELHEFTFGGRFRAGGDLRGLYNWTIDGGSGMINSLVAVSGGGDLVIYQGTDPDFASSFGLKGVWSVGGGGVPKGRRIATDFGGDLLVLTTIGLIPISKLVMGNPVFDRSQYATSKIATLFNQAAVNGRDLDGWSLRVHPEDNTLLVTMPQLDGTMQVLVMALTTKGWSIYRDLPIMMSSEAWQGKLYIGDKDGKIHINTGYLDNDGTQPVQWEVLTSFQNYGTQRKKLVHHIRPTFITSGGNPQFAAAPRFGYDFSELGTISIPGVIPNGVQQAFLVSRGIDQGDQVFLNGMLQIINDDYFLVHSNDFTAGGQWDQGIWDADFWDVGQQQKHGVLCGDIIVFLVAPLATDIIQVFSEGLPVNLGIARGDLWDVARWDESHWAFQQASQPVAGGSGMGQDVAIILRGAANSRTSLVGIDVLYQVGGLL
jgi:hypothetical protein